MKKLWQCNLLCVFFRGGKQQGEDERLSSMESHRKRVALRGPARGLVCRMSVMVASSWQQQRDGLWGAQMHGIEALDGRKQADSPVISGDREAADRTRGAEARGGEAELAARHSVHVSVLNRWRTEQRLATSGANKR